MISKWKDKALFTPGPLTTSRTTKQAMLLDLGSRDPEFITIVREVRQRLVELAMGQGSHTTILMQGSGTFGIEAVLSSIIAPGGKILVLNNGAYGSRMVKIAKTHKIDVIDQKSAEDQEPDIALMEKTLQEDPHITHIAVVHCETTTGIINPIENYCKVAKKYGKTTIVDAMSSFGAYSIDVHEMKIDFLISSSNKCIEGVPGFSFIIANKDQLELARGMAHTVSLDIVSQADGLEQDGQFRFTPPTQVLLAFYQALLELEMEGGVIARAGRYQVNYNLTLDSMQSMGFVPYLSPEKRGYIITSFHYPNHPNFSFANFYKKLSDLGFAIYPGKLSQVDCFRIGHIGRLSEGDITGLILAIGKVLQEMDIALPKGSRE